MIVEIYLSYDTGRFPRSRGAGRQVAGTPLGRGGGWG